mmetsp:Transcript_12035/g.28194  ORF Transcript_12035/g.28194 Transcript_12035/m.28194 type:complete len:235 (-) Transcript_12035:600-1304(-)
MPLERPRGVPTRGSTRQSGRRRACCPDPRSHSARERYARERSARVAGYCEPWSSDSARTAPRVRWCGRVRRGRVRPGPRRGLGRRRTSRPESANHFDPSYCPGARRLDQPGGWARRSLLGAHSSRPVRHPLWDRRALAPPPGPSPPGLGRRRAAIDLLAARLPTWRDWPQVPEPHSPVERRRVARLSRGPGAPPWPDPEVAPPAQSPSRFPGRCIGFRGTCLLRGLAASPGDVT